ncbi:MAG: ribonuclease Z [Bacteroidales bacterium]|nr:ribonuclease Z [Candidatus Cryptobacteroides faecihippi]MCQ2161897.1 ribonuclease Z [Bacteroidales bacterium]
MDFTLTVLGTASAKPTAARYQSAQVLTVHGRSFLIDCGEGVQTRLQTSRISLMKIESVFISHIHGDHVFGIFGLLSTMGMLSRTQPLNIYAPVSFGPILRFFMSYYGDGIAFDVIHNPLNMKEPTEIYSTKSLSVSAFPLNHKIEAFGFLFREKEPQFNVKKWKIDEYSLTLTEIGTVKRGEDVRRVLPDGTEQVIPVSELGYKPFNPRSYAYCSDTAPFPEEASWVHGVDILYHEATYLSSLEDQAKARFHSTTLQAAACARQAEVGKLVIGHYSSRNKDPKQYEAECRSIFSESYAADDGDVFDVPLVKLD